MNKKQRLVLLIGIIIIVLMSVYPPWCICNPDNGENLRCLGYALLTTPPSTPMENADIDYTRLSFQWIMVVIVTGGFLLIFKDRRIQSSNDLSTSRR